MERVSEWSERSVSLRFLSILEKWFPLHGEPCIFVFTKGGWRFKKNNRNVKEEETEQTYYLKHSP